MTDIAVKRRFRTSSVTLVVSVALVLIMMGLLSVLVLKSRDVTTWVKENIMITATLAPDAKEVDVIALQKSIDAEKWRKSTEFVSKEEAAKRLQADLGDDFLQTLGYNPLPPSIEIHLKAEYADSANISTIANQLRGDERVKDVYYQQDMISTVNERMGTISLVIGIFSLALLFIAVGLIFNTIRLSIYSQRFLIRTMDLVGATQSFIRRPFVFKGIINGIIGAVIAIVITTGIIFALDKNFTELELIKFADLKTLGILCVLQIVLGILITWLSTAMAVRKFLRQGTDALYSN